MESRRFQEPASRLWPEVFELFNFGELNDNFGRCIKG